LSVLKSTLFVFETRLLGVITAVQRIISTSCKYSTVVHAPSSLFPHVFLFLFKKNCPTEITEAVNFL